MSTVNGGRSPWAFRRWVGWVFPEGQPSQRMGFLEHLFRKPDPTAGWKAEPGMRIELDFGCHALCGVKIGDPFPWLEKLGPAEDPRAARRGRFCYHSKGVEVEMKNGVVTSYLLVWASPVDSHYRPFAGVCLYRGRDLRLSARTNEREIFEHFGSPYWRDQDQDEILLFYEFEDIEWQIELALDGSLKAGLCVTPPLLADPEQRAAYRVTKPWPP